MHVPDKVMAWLGPMIIAGIGILVIVPSPVGQQVFCDRTANCLATWVGALSGWAALAGALFTINVMQGQLREQKRQTDFMLGDAPPTLDAIEHLQEKSELVVRIVNWNRRAIIIDYISAAAGGYILISYEAYLDGKRIHSQHQLAEGRTIPLVIIPGWENRSEAPHHVQYRIEAWADTDLTTQENWQNIPTIKARATILGDKHDVTILTADTRAAVH